LCGAESIQTSAVCFQARSMAPIYALHKSGEQELMDVPRMVWPNQFNWKGVEGRRIEQYMVQGDIEFCAKVYFDNEGADRPD